MVEVLQETLLRNAVKGFREVKEHEKSYSPALNCFSSVIEYPKQGSLSAAALSTAGLSGREQVVGFEVV